MIRLHGFALSNYYNKVKFALLEYHIPFEEVLMMPSLSDEAVLAHSPLGKVPFIQTDQGDICESQVIIEYLAACYPDKGIFPADPFHAAKVRECVTFIELHIELVARELYKQAFFGGVVTDATQAHVQKRLIQNIAGFKRLVKFSPDTYLSGDNFGMADIVAYVSLPLVGEATQAVYGTDLLFNAGIDWKSYVARIGERPAAQRVSADRHAYISTH